MRSFIPDSGKLIHFDVAVTYSNHTDLIRSMKISLKLIPNGPINDIPVLVQIMAWRWLGDKPLSEPAMIGMYASLGLN